MVCNLNTFDYDVTTGVALNGAVDRAKQNIKNHFAFRWNFRRARYFSACDGNPFASILQKRAKNL